MDRSAFGIEHEPISKAVRPGMAVQQNRAYRAAVKTRTKAKIAANGGGLKGAAKTLGQGIKNDATNTRRAARDYFKG